MIESLIEEDDVIIDDVIEKTNKLGDLTENITNFFGRREYNTTRETLLGDICQLLSDTIEVTVITMIPRACRVSFSSNSEVESYIIQECPTDLNSI